MPKIHWSDDEKIKQAVASSNTFGQAIVALGVKNHGGNYKTLKRAIRRLNLDTSHMTHQCWAKGRKVKEKHPLSYYLVKDCPSQMKTNALKKRMIREGLFTLECSSCKNTEWMGQPIPLELHHKNGDILDNTLENLCLVCPNCHAQTDNFRAKNRKKVEKVWDKCQDCGNNVQKNTKRCFKCHNKAIPRKIDYPPTSELLEKLKTQSLYSLAKELGISDNGLRKRIKNHPVE